MNKQSNGNYEYNGYEIVKAGRKWLVGEYVAKNLSEAQAIINAMPKQEANVDKAEAKKEYQRKRWNNRSEEAKAEYRSYRQARWNTRTPEEVEADKAYRKARYLRLKAEAKA